MAAEALAIERGRAGDGGNAVESEDGRSPDDYHPQHQRGRPGILERPTHSQRVQDPGDDRNRPGNRRGPRVHNPLHRHHRQVHGGSIVRPHRGYLRAFRVDDLLQIYYCLPHLFYTSSTALLLLRSKCGSLLRASISSLKMRFFMLRPFPLVQPKQKNKKSSKSPTPTPATPYHPFPSKNTIRKFDFFKLCGIFICRGEPAWSPSVS